jgi:hypothetical protein
MKATVKATGFTYNVTGFSDDGSLKLEDGNWYSMEELEIGEGYDWNQVRIQAAIAAMQAELSNPNNTFMMCEDKRTIIVQSAVDYADTLIEELQKKTGQDDNRRD